MIARVSRVALRLRPRAESSLCALLILGLLAPRVLSGAALSPADALFNQVGALGRPEALVIEGNQTFTRKQILLGIAAQFDFDVASHPAAPLDVYLTLLTRRIRLGYRHAGFPDVDVRTSVVDTQRVLVRVTEGPRYRCGDILISGIPSMTNETVRSKLINVLQGHEEPPPLVDPNPSTLVVWSPGEPAPFDAIPLTRLTGLVRNGLAALNHYQPKVSLRCVPDRARGLADLRIDIADEGIQGTVSEIEVNGLFANTQAQVLEYLHLKPGMALRADIVSATSNELWRCARFFRQDVTLTPRRAAGEFKLTLELEEVSEAPSLTEPFSPTEAALLKFRDWLAGWKTRGENFVLSASLTNSPWHPLVEAVLSASGLAVIARDNASDAPSKFLHAFLAVEDRVEFHSPWRGSQFSFVRAAKDMHISLQISPPSPASHELPMLRFSSIQGEPQKDAFDLDVDLQPAVFLHLAHESSTTLQSGEVTLRMARNGYWRQTRLEAATGRLIELFQVQPITGFSGSNAVVLRLQAEDGAFERRRQWIATASAHHTNEYVANRGFSPWIHFALTDLLESPWFRHLCDRVLTKPGDRREWERALSRVDAGMVLARDLLAQPAFNRVLESLNGFITADTNSAIATIVENDFEMPDEGSPAGGTVEPWKTGLWAWLFVGSDDLPPPDWWPRTLLRQLLLLDGGERRYAQFDLDGLLRSDQFGPLGALFAASVFVNADPRMARTLAEHGLSRLTPDALHRDYLVLLQTNGVLGRMAGGALESLGGASQAGLRSAAAALPPDEAALLRQLARLLRSAEGRPPSEAAWPAFADHWDKVLRPGLETGLKRFLPQVEFLTNRQALYERGLAVLSAGRVELLDEAFKCFRKAAEQGHAGAQLQLGRLYAQGLSVPTDYGKAMRWYRKAMEQHEPHADCEIARLYLNGQGVPQNQREALRWFRLGAEADCPTAQYYVGLLSEGKTSSAEALSWFRKAAQAGRVPAQARAGDLLSDGLFVVPDYVEACQWLILAAKEGDKLSAGRLRRVKGKMTVEQLKEANARAAALTRRFDEAKALEQANTP